MPTPAGFGVSVIDAEYINDKFYFLSRAALAKGSQGDI
jgi:hypothetical protein